MHRSSPRSGPRRPWPSLRRVCDDAPRPIREINPEIPAWLEAIIERLHAKDPAERFASASEVADLLGRCLAHVQEPGHNPLPTLTDERGRKLPRRRSLLRQWRARVAIAIVTTAILAGAGLMFGRWPAVDPGAAPTHDSQATDPSTSGSVGSTLTDAEFQAKTTEIRTRLEGMRESDTGADPVRADQQHSSTDRAPRNGAQPISQVTVPFTTEQETIPMNVSRTLAFAFTLAAAMSTVVVAQAPQPHGVNVTYAFLQQSEPLQLAQQIRQGCEG